VRFTLRGGHRNLHVVAAFQDEEMHKGLRLWWDSARASFDTIPQTKANALTGYSIIMRPLPRPVAGDARPRWGNGFGRTIAVDGPLSQFFWPQPRWMRAA
jgi:hypothetical protein